ncbi:MAG TPA: DUF882 domain-containing protein [Xanthobacteraceae bacterium]
MPIDVARKICSSSIPARAGYCAGFAALLLAISCNSLQNATAEGDTRTISLHHMHTEEDLTITYKVNGRYDEEALKKLDYELRDWRRDETIHMDPRLIDLVWEVHRDVGSSEPIWIVCGYRSPQTNAMLRQRSSGVAKFSQHTLGKAMDFYIPGVPLEQLRAIGLYLQRGGVGFYPTSGSPFVHLDTGNVRHWPAIAADQMPRLMAQGQSLHAAAEATEVAGNRRQPAVLAKLGGTRTAPDRDAVPATAASRPAPVISLAAAQIDKPNVVPLPQSKPSRPQPATYEVASAESRPVQLRPAQAASLVTRPSPSANEIINQRDYWSNVPADPVAAPPAAQANAAIPRPPASIPTPPPAAVVVVASADPDATASFTASLAPWPLPERGDPRSAGALAYADPTAPVMAQARPAPMGTALGRPAAPPDTTVAVKRIGDRPSVISSSPSAPAATAAAAPSASKTGDHFNEPWLRALIVSPSAQDFMSASSFGVPDYRGLAPLMRKPSSTVMMTFSSDPQLGMTARKFSGTAVVFVSTVTFGIRTASLR